MALMSMHVKINNIKFLSTFGAKSLNFAQFCTIAHNNIMHSVIHIHVPCQCQYKFLFCISFSYLVHGGGMGLRQRAVKVENIHDASSVDL